MKQYEHQPLHLVRCTISKIGDETFYINLCETTQDEAMEKLKEIIDGEKLSVFQDGNRTRIDVRDCIGGSNGKCKSISFKGLNPKQTYDLLTSKIPK